MYDIRFEKLERQNLVYREALGHIVNLANSATAKNYNPDITVIRIQAENALDEGKGEENG